MLPIVLGAAQWNGKPSPVFEGRLKQGIELYEEGHVDYLIFTGGKSEQAASSEAEVGRNYALEKGIPEEDILYEDSSLMTEDNIINAKEVTEEKNLETFLIVSDQFHLKRRSPWRKVMGCLPKVYLPSIRRISRLIQSFLSSCGSGDSGWGTS